MGPFTKGWPVGEIIREVRPEASLMRWVLNLSVV